MLYTNRYHNVFFAYRGAAVSDVELTQGRQLEDNLTRALVVTLEAISGTSHQCFVRDVCGAEDGAAMTRAKRRLELQPLPPEPREPARVQLLLGISPDGGVGPGTLEPDSAGSRADALIAFGTDLLVVIESKAVGACDGAQLARHAYWWGIDPATRKGIPATWRMVTWQRVADWARSSMDAEDRPVGRFLLGQLADYLDLAGVTTRSVVQVAPAPRVEVDETIPVWMDDLATAIDLNRVSTVCDELYGDVEGEHHVCGDKQETEVDCRVDSRRVAEAYRAVREKVPPVLLQNGGNVITPRRALSILYGPNRYEQSVAVPEVRKQAGKLIGVGVDRAVLLGMLAWAWDKPGRRPSLMRQIIAQAWEQAPVTSHAAPELHDGLGERIDLILADTAAA